MELEALNAVSAEIRDLGAELAAVSPQLPEHSREQTRTLGLTFDILGDPGNTLASRLGIAFTLPEDIKALYLKFGIDLEKANGETSWVLPMPARFIVDREGIIRYAQYDPDYTVRPEPEHTVAVLRSLGGG
jgi:peroxiredoxin